MRKIMFLWLYVVAIVASLGGLLSGYDTGVISGALLFINDSWNLSDSMQGIVVSSVLIGAVIGAATNGVLADIFGRKKIIMATAVIFIVGSILCGFAPNVYVLIASRILVGLAVGIVNFVIPLYLSEISPKVIRGTLVSLYQWAITAGILFSYFINAAFANAIYSWRWMLLAGILPGLVLLVGMSLMSDTPRWLVSKNRDEEAKKVFKKIDPNADTDAEIAEIKNRELNISDCRIYIKRFWFDNNIRRNRILLLIPSSSYLHITAVVINTVTDIMWLFECSNISEGFLLVPGI